MYTLEDIFLFNPKSPLNFTQYLFWAMFAVLLLFYTLVYRRSQARMLYLLGFSLFFYYKQGGYFFFLLIFSTFFDFLVGRAIHRSQTPWKRKFWLITSVTTNLVILCFFKYAYFFTDLVNQALGTHLVPLNVLSIAANAVTGSEQFSVTNIILPVGISFFTFQTISYAVDLYRRKIEPVKNIIDFGFFVTYFPQLVAGPIVRAAEFMPQMYKPYYLTKEDFNRAVYLIVNGLIKKILISDFISLTFVDQVFGAPLSYSGLVNLLAVYGYSMQIYCDFSGYTDMAIGISLLLGYSLPINFNSPYKSVNITDFWRRWHISLSSWLRDYLYISLGGNRKGKFRQYLNLFLTMLLGGLWHGSHMRFIIWGALHGVALAFHKLWSGWWPRRDRPSPILNFLSGLLTFHFVAFCWIFFRAANMQKVNEMLSQILYDFQPQLLADVLNGYRNVFMVMILGYVVHLMPLRYKNILKTRYMELPLPAQAVVIAVVVILVYQVSSMGSQPFIYFQF